jgi:outer membrane usher protein
MREATARLIGPNGKPLPTGTPVRVNEAGEAYVGLDGEVFLRGLDERNALSAPDGESRCTYRFDFPKDSADLIPDLGALPCAK